jgi:hypothetical protein
MPTGGKGFQRWRSPPPVMSALGQKQTYAVQNGMSALLPIATAKADSRERLCPVCPRKRHQMRHMECPLRAKSGHRLDRTLNVKTPSCRLPHVRFAAGHLHRHFCGHSRIYDPCQPWERVGATQSVAHRRAPAHIPLDAERRKPPVRCLLSNNSGQPEFWSGAVCPLMTRSLN